MKAITLWQPWASAVALGLKTVETRSWRTSYRGPLAIHAGRMPVAEVMRARPSDGAAASRHRWNWDYFREAFRLAAEVELEDLPRGVVVAMGLLVDCVPAHSAAVSRLQLPWGNFAPRRWAFLLEDVRPLPEPIPARGLVGLWDWRGAKQT